ncbi:MAG: ferredoxin [Dissulfurimicrobium sp.]|uniref:ferredoxin n=1 Tax=Dissulfurimicrobium TaxID=1769732 RepID=UPI002ED60C13|nr:ferredoxin [Dissulfurimicrobium hydrothermale]
MSKKIYIDTEECLGCQSCVEPCPDVFGFDDGAEKAFVIIAEGGPEVLMRPLSHAQQGISMCKKQAFCFASNDTAEPTYSM